ncbi:MAG TPA: hypothetical protein VMR29_09945 [Candidatus Binatia bacterium]|nr:hypothetical protein [Candidatus Binatia bacterium]
MKIVLALLALLVAACGGVRSSSIERPAPRYARFYSEVTGGYVTAPPCDWIPLVRHDGVVIGCLHAR